MKRFKYQPRVGENHGENKIKEEQLKEQFGKQFKLIWNGHSHFALDENTGEMFYIFKTLMYLYPVNEFWQYNKLSRKYPIKDGKENKMTKKFCDICGKELTMFKQISAYNVAITNKDRMLRAPHTRYYPEVCEDCAKEIANIIDALKGEN